MSFTYAHMCRSDHQQIGHNDSEHERCPLCRANDHVERLEEALRECAEPFRFGTDKGVEWESIAREFNRRQGVAADAIGIARCRELPKSLTET